MEQKVENFNFTRTLQIYSGHDTTIKSIRSALRLADISPPPYAATLMFELRKNGSDNIVTVNTRTIFTFIEGKTLISYILSEVKLHQLIIPYFGTVVLQEYNGQSLSDGGTRVRVSLYSGRIHQSYEASNTRRLGRRV